MGLVTGPHAHTCCTQSQLVVGPGGTSGGRVPKVRAVGGGRAPDPGRPTARQEVPYPAALVSPP